MIDHGYFGGFDGRFLGIDLVGVGPGADPFPWLAPTQLDASATGPLAHRVEREDPLSLLLHVTSLTHELRHFHDFMLSPLGSFVVRSRYLATLNTWQTLPWVAASSTVVPVPLNAWFRLSPDERQRYWMRWSGLSHIGAESKPLLVNAHVPVGDLDPGFVADEHMRETATGLSAHVGVSNPDDVDGSLARIFRVILVQFARAECALQGDVIGGARLYPMHVFEANALIAQVQHIGMTLGPQALGSVLTELERMSESYSLALRLAFGAANGAAPQEGPINVPLSDAVMLCTYALLGTCEPVLTYAQSVRRLLAVGAMCPSPAMDESAEDRFANWDDALSEIGAGDESTLAGLERSLEDDREFIKMLQIDVKSLAYSELARPTTVSCIEFLQARRALCNAFLTDPERYVRPGAYLRGLGAFPRPPVRLRVAADDVDRTIDALEGAGWTECVQTRATGIVGYPPAALFPGENAFRTDALVTATDAGAAAEMIATENPAIADAGREVVSEVFGEQLSMMRVLTRLSETVRWRFAGRDGETPETESSEPDVSAGP